MRFFALLVLLGTIPLSAGAESPLVIAPHIHGRDFCPEAADDPKIVTEADAVTLCRGKGSNSAARIAALLDAIGPAVSPSHRYALGYTLSLPLLGYFVQRDGAWSLDRAALQTDVDLIRDVDRPVVVYLSANHFADDGAELTKSLAADDRNLMWTQKGPLRSDGYFGLSVNAWTLADPDAPVTMMRRQAFAAAVEQICALDETARHRIVAVSILGEVQQLYPNFSGGMGFSSDEQVTDYSPVSVDGFRHWLAERYGGIAALNEAIHGHFADFGVVSPPDRNVLKAGGDPFSHLAPSAAGTLPIYGWVYDGPNPPPRITLYIDGVNVAESIADLNRTDVPEADQTVKTPNVGWRFDYDYRALPPGTHLLELTAAGSDGRLARFGFRPFTVEAPDGSAVPGLATGLPVPPGSQLTEGMRLYIDGPADGEKILYNGLAGLWLEYRNLQVRHYYEQFSKLTEQSCLASDLVFSHEITPQLNATWNSDLMAVSAAQQPDSFFHPGATLYGGEAFGDAFFRLKASKGWTTYGVSEMHPTFDLTIHDMQAMLERHRLAGARFVAPYYLDIMPARIPRLQNKLYEWRITEDNAKYGSANFYHAISDLMRNQ